MNYDSKSMSQEAPTYQVFPGLNASIAAFYTGRGASATNKFFTFRRPVKDDQDAAALFNENLLALATQAGFETKKLVMPADGWNHTGTSIKVEEHEWVVHQSTETLMPAPVDGKAISYDALATRSRDFVLAVQGADCPSVFLCDIEAGVIGAAHAGWRTLVRGIIGSVVRDMTDLGATAERIMAYVSPGCGDSYNCFGWGESMTAEIAAVFKEAGEDSLLDDTTIRHRLTDEAKEELRRTTNGSVTDESFAVSEFAERRLLEAGLRLENVSRSPHSTIVTRSKGPEVSNGEETAYRYHSYRRDKPNHGLGISVIFLK